MTTNNDSHLKNLLQLVVSNTLLLAKHLETLGISRNLQQYYKRSGWLKSMAPGVYYLPQDQPNWLGGVYTMQKQALLPTHPGGLTALSLQGMAHYIRLGQEPLYIFIATKTKLPKWFIDHNWQQPLKNYATDFLPNELALVEYKNQNFTINISSPERAILECLYLAPNKMDLIECYHLIEGLVNLRPSIIQELLEACRSIKTKRLFLYMAEKAEHAWFKYLDQSKFDLGVGDRLLVKNGVYIKSYAITVSKELNNL